MFSTPIIILPALKREYTAGGSNIFLIKGGKIMQVKVIRVCILYILMAILILAVLPLILIERMDATAEEETDDTVPVVSVLMSDNETQSMTIEDFLVGVVAAEMPASFEIEALKAQAIVARTYVLYHSPLPQGIGGRHGEIAVCTDPNHCQAYISVEEMQKRWGKNSEANLAKIRQAVKETQGLVITYQGELVETPFFSTCGGQTESAKDCWGSERAWLQSVSCPYCTASKHYQGEMQFTLSKAAKLLDVKKADLKKMVIKSHTDGKRVAIVQIGEKEISGTEMRSKLGLESANFTFSIEDSKIIFQTYGYGHGVGMCQYGAGGMAKEGKTAAQIVHYYYQDIEIEAVY